MIRSFAGGVVLAVAAVLGTPAAAVAEDHAATQAALDAYLGQAGPGAAVHAGNGAEAWTLTSGTAVLNQNQPITPADHFRIGSQTKVFTAAVVLQLVDEGLVELDAPVERYLPGVVTGNYDGDVVTVRQLLQHTSGLTRDVSGAAAGPDGTYQLAELVRAAMDDPPQFTPPGADLRYSNVGYLVLGLLIERLTGEPVNEAITNRIIEPLGLTDTSFPAPGERALPVPYLPGYTGGRLGPFFFWIDSTTSIELSFWTSAGAMASTMENLVEFYQALLDGEVISPVALAEMRATLPPANAYGLGLSRVDLPCGGAAWGHNGALGTGHYSLTLVTDDGRFATMVTNTMATGAAAASVDVVESALCEAA